MNKHRVFWGSRHNWNGWHIEFMRPHDVPGWKTFYYGDLYRVAGLLVTSSDADVLAALNDGHGTPGPLSAEEVEFDRSEMSPQERVVYDRTREKAPGEGAQPDHL